MTRRREFALLTLLVAALSGASPGQESTLAPEKTLSPFFFVQTDDPELDQLPLKGVSATVRISGVIADVTIEQVYTNEGGKPLEATYVFPASTRAAVYGMEMTIGDRTITAEIREREQARQEYEQAREEGMSASLLEEQRPNVFQMSVANILPGDTIRVELKYTELLVPTEGAYEFVYPTVVGPRYSNKSLSEANPEDLFVASPYTHEGEPPKYTFGIEVDLNAGIPIQELECTSHAVTVEYVAPDHANVHLSPSEEYGGNRDYILRYRLAGDQIATGLLLYEGESENFFLFMGQPPARVEDAEIPPREYIFIMDVSGSMHGFPISVSKALLRDLISALRPTDCFNVLLFAGGSAVLSQESIPATPENVNWAIQVIEGQVGGGGTELLPAMERALQLPRPSELTARTIVIATDGYVDVEPETFALIREHLGEANMFAFGIGTSVNRFLIEGMARAGMGEPFVVTSAAEAPDMAARFWEYIRTPVLTQVRFETGDFDAYDVEPVSIPDILAERPVIIFGKWRGGGQGTLTLSGKTGRGDYVTQLEAGSVQASDANAALRYLWARHRIATLGDYAGPDPGEELKQAITELGLTYNLLTPYTSFVAVDRVVRRDGTELTRVEQPLPLPQGVEDTAVGGYGVTAAGATGVAADATDAVAGPLATATWFGKVFRLSDGVWIDSEYRAGAPVEEYTEGSGLPKELLRFASLEQDMIVVVASRAYRLRTSMPVDMPTLIQNAPNPFNAETVIGFILRGEGGQLPVVLAIYDLAGQRIRTYQFDALGPGLYTVKWDGRDEQGHAVSSGAYVYRLSTPKHARTRKMILLR